MRAAVGFFVFGLAFALRRESEPAWMYGAAVAAYGVGTFAGSAVAPLLRRRYGEDRLTAGALVALAIVAGFAALGASRALVLLVSVVLGAAAAVGRQGFDALVQTRAPGASHGRSFARFETRFQLGWVAGAIAAVAVAIPTRYSLAVVAVALVPVTWLYVRTLREAHDAHVEDPFDPVEIARRRIDHAIEWHHRHLDRLAVTELAGVVDLARALGTEMDAPSIVRLDALRTAALSTWPLDTREVYWAIERAVALIEQLERTSAGDRQPTPAAASATGASGLAGGQHRRRGDRPLRRDELHREHALRPVDVGPVDLDGDVDRVALRCQRPDGDQQPVVTHRGIRLVLEDDLGPGVGELHVDVLVELADDLRLHRRLDLLLPHADDEHDRQHLGVGRRRLLADHVTDRRDVDLGVARQLLAPGSTAADARRGRKRPRRTQPTISPRPG